jgi:hypothetical protein
MPSSLQTQLHSDTAALATPTGRRVGQPGHDQAREFLLGRLDEIGLEPFSGGSFELPYRGKLPQTGREHTFTNLVGVVPGRSRSLPPLLLGAHYDSVIDAPCADDNATSVALNLAIAELVLEKPLDRDLIIALYDAEEPPYFLSSQMGSTRFFEDHCSGIELAGTIVTDLIGHDFEPGDLIEFPGPNSRPLDGMEKIVFMTGAESDGVFPGLVEEVAKNHPGLRIFPL